MNQAIRGRFVTDARGIVVFIGSFDGCHAYREQHGGTIWMLFKPHAMPELGDDYLAAREPVGAEQC